MRQSGFRLDLVFFQSQPISLTLLIILRLTLRVPPFIIHILRRACRVPSLQNIRTAIITQHQVIYTS